MVHAVTPVIGLDLSGTNNQTEGKQVALGTPVLASDGLKYVYVEAGAALSAGDEVSIDASTFAVTAGAGGFETLVDMASGARAWVKSTTI